jgi:Txe/YoeB family toxin of toxin-antitoxin system
MFRGIGLVSWRIVYTKQAQKNAKRIASVGLKVKTEKLLNILRNNLYQTPPSFEKLVGDILGAYSRRINIQHRWVYPIIDDAKTVKALRLWTHYF